MSASRRESPDTVGAVVAGRYVLVADFARMVAPPAGDEHPFVQPFAGVAERCVAGQPFAGAETVERDGEVLDEGE